jgi:UDPglucose 6-dehydrogenase
MSNATLAVIGLGKLGAPLAVCLAARGFSVIGVDRDEEAVRAVNEGRAPPWEPSLPAYLARSRERLSATSDLRAAVAAAEATFVLVSSAGGEETPVTAEHVRAVCAEIGGALARRSDYHLVVIASTVPPQSTERELVPALEAASGKVCGRDFGLCHAPEFVALGALIEGFLRPSYALIGEYDTRSGDRLAEVYAALFEVPVEIVRTNIVSAEIAKLAFNNFVAAKISFANLLAQLCERIPGADVDAVTGALQRDPRIGPWFMRGALSYGGPCLPRDVAALTRLAAALHLEAGFPMAVERINRDRLEDLAQCVRRAADSAAARLGRAARVGILGLAFKPGCDVVDGSPGVALTERLAAEGRPVLVHDPAVRSLSVRGGTLVASAEDCVCAADVVVVATPWPEYARLPAAVWSGRVLIDCWRLIDANAAAGALQYVALGIGPPAADRDRSASR